MYFYILDLCYVPLWGYYETSDNVHRGCDNMLTFNYIYKNSPMYLVGFAQNIPIEPQQLETYLENYLQKNDATSNE